MLGRIISVPLALILALPAGSQSLSDGSAPSNLLPWWQTGRHATSSSDSSDLSDLSPTAAQSYSQSPQNIRTGIEFPKMRLGRVAVVSAPLIAEGLVAKKLDGRFRGLRNDYIPDFKKSADDYLQYSPLAVMVGLKALGVESRSSWERMAVSDAISAVLMAGIVGTLKNTTNVTRPDGSDDRSFPSGHTATAFMTATMLTKEYGSVSPWIGVGAYSVAAATGLMRVANNKHWLSDVLTGAGVGILATEAGYWITDLILKDKGLSATYADYPDDVSPSTSFLGLYLGVNLPLSDYDIDETNEFRTSTGSTAGLEGAWFPWRHFGIGGRFTATNTLIFTDDDEAKNSFDAVSFSGGGYFSLPLSSFWSAGAKLLGGYVRYPKLSLAGKTVPSAGGFTFGTGMSLSFKVNSSYGMRLFLDYNLLPPHSKSSNEYMNMLTLGTSFVVLL